MGVVIVIVVIRMRKMKGGRQREMEGGSEDVLSLSRCQGMSPRKREGEGGVIIVVGTRKRVRVH